MTGSDTELELELESEALLDAELESAINQAYATLGSLTLWLISSFVAIALVADLLVDGPPLWRELSVPLAVAAILGAGLWLAEQDRLDRPQLFVLSFTVASIPSARALLESFSNELSPAIFVSSPDFGLWLVAIIAAGLSFDGPLARSLGLWCGLQSIGLFALGRSTFTEHLLGSPELIESLTRLDWAVVRALMLVALGVIVGRQGVFVRKLVRGIQLRVRESERARAQVDRVSTAKSAFLLDIGHELRDPLNASLAYTESLLRQPALDHRVRDGLQHIHASGEHLRALADDLLDVSTIEAGRVRLLREPVHVAGLLREVAGMLAGRVRGRPVEIFVELGEGTPAWVTGDPKHLRQVLLNLGSNALKFTPRGSVCLAVTAGVGMRFSVRDTGSGIPEELADVLFEPFAQAGSEAQRSQGLGLGLTISRRLVRLMGGELTLDSAPGEGCTFSFELPLPAIQSADAEPRADAARPSPRLLSELRALAADGAMKELATRLKGLEVAAPHLAVFTRRALQLAESFEDEALIVLLDGTLADR